MTKHAHVNSDDSSTFACPKCDGSKTFYVSRFLYPDEEENQSFQACETAFWRRLLHNSD